MIFSTLPERFAKLGHKVYIQETMELADGSQTGVIARNDEVMELVWYSNPFISGTSPFAPNAGYVLHGKFYDLVNRLPEGSAIAAMEMAHGLPPPYNYAPKIYYEPQPYHQDLSKVVLYDPAALSSAIDGQGWSKFQQKMMDRFGGENQIYLVTHDPSVSNVPPFAEGTATIGVGSVWQYIDMMAACRAWIGSESGAQALAAAVRGERDNFDLAARPEIVSLMAPNTRNSGSYCFRGVCYRTSVYAAGNDYLEPTEVPQHRYEHSCGVNVRAKLASWRERKAALNG